MNAAAGPAGEVVGLDQSIAYAQRLAALAGDHAPDGNEAYLAHLAAAGLQGAAVDTAQRMQDAFATAQAAAQHHATALAEQRGVQATYDHHPDAGDKAFHQTGGADQAPPPDERPGPEPTNSPDGVGHPPQDDQDEEPERATGHASWYSALFGCSSDEEVYELYDRRPDPADLDGGNQVCEGCGTNHEVVVVVDPYPYEMLGEVRYVRLCWVCYACRSQEV